MRVVDHGLHRDTGTGVDAKLIAVRYRFDALIDRQMIDLASLRGELECRRDLGGAGIARISDLRAVNQIDVDRAARPEIPAADINARRAGFGVNNWQQIFFRSSERAVVFAAAVPLVIIFTEIFAREKFRVKRCKTFL